MALIFKLSRPEIIFKPSAYNAELSKVKGWNQVGPWGGANAPTDGRDRTHSVFEMGVSQRA